MDQPRVLVIQDISASCRISMNVALPVLSTLQNGVSILPTALLSTHTGSGFEHYTFLDLTGEMRKILAHWRQLGLRFDGILAGYLGSREQVSLVGEIVEEFLTEDGLFILDPVMGDHGEAYPGFDQAFVREIRTLCREADILIPNLTEAALLLEREWRPAPYTVKEIQETLESLRSLTGGEIVLTGVRFNDDLVGGACLSAREERFYYHGAPLYPGHFDGTGDLFSSVVAGFCFQKKSLAFATATAVEYVNRVIARTATSGIDSRYGVRFEMDLPYLMECLQERSQAEWT